MAGIESQVVVREPPEAFDITGLLTVYRKPRHISCRVELRGALAGKDLCCKAEPRCIHVVGPFVLVERPPKQQAPKGGLGDELFRSMPPRGSELRSQNLSPLTLCNT